MIGTHIRSPYSTTSPASAPADLRPALAPADAFRHSLVLTTCSNSKRQLCTNMTKDLWHLALLMHCVTHSIVETWSTLRYTTPGHKIDMGLRHMASTHSPTPRPSRASTRRSRVFTDAYVNSPARGKCNLQSRSTPRTNSLPCHATAQPTSFRQHKRIMTSPTSPDKPFNRTKISV
jgi:hypothetical protein